MEKLKTNTGIVFLVIALTLGAVLFFSNKGQTGKSPEVNSAPINSSTIQTEDQAITYSGQSGKDALTLLKQVALVEQNASGLVTGIKGRAAQDTKQEYWAFYVNGKMSEVGPGEYVTKEGDKIEWKIEKY